MLRNVDATKGHQISKNYKLGDKVETFEELVKLSIDKKAVFYKPFGIYLPAARVLFMNRHYYHLYQKIQDGDFVKLEKI